MWIDEVLTNSGKVFKVETQGLKGVISLATFKSFHEASQYIKLNSGVEIC